VVVHLVGEDPDPEDEQDEADVRRAEPQWSVLREAIGEVLAVEEADEQQGAHDGQGGAGHGTAHRLRVRRSLRSSASSTVFIG
jgi:hypothetical protein